MKCRWDLSDSKIVSTLKLRDGSISFMYPFEAPKSCIAQSYQMCTTLKIISLKVKQESHLFDKIY